MNSGGAAHDYCVLCAKPDELRQVIEIFNIQFERLRRDQARDQVYAVPIDSEKYGAAGVKGKETILVTTCSGMGHISASVRTAQVVYSHKPGVLIFVGTAASLKPSEIQLGDVVIPRKAIMRFYDKVSEKGQKDYDERVVNGDFRELFFGENALISDIATIDCSPDALGIIANTPIGTIALEGGQPGSVQIGGENFAFRDPKVFDDVDIFSCGMVVDSVSYRTFLTSMAQVSMRKVGIIDMESYGFFNSINASRQTGVGLPSCTGIMIRGISDYAGRKQPTELLPSDWKSKSVRNAALVARQLIAGWSEANR